MWQIEFENLVLEEVLSDWESFLFSSDIYWQVQLSGKNIPATYKKMRVSPGRLLLSKELLSKEVLEGELTQKEISRNLEKFKSEINQWKANWEKKVAMELPIRARQWQRIIQEMDHDREYSTHQLAYDIQIRLMLALLLQNVEISSNSEINQLIMVSDMKFKTFTFEDSFILDEKYSSIFHKDQYEFLYRSTRNPGDLP